jgi:hypothetical protein
MEVMKSVCVFFSLLVIAFSIPLAFGGAPDKPTVQGKLLDQNTYPCENCFFGASTYYFCFEADNKILIGYEKIPTMNWRDSQANWLTRVHKSWKPLATEGDASGAQTFPLRYDEKDIWITRPEGKPIKLKQDYATDIFINSQACRAAVKKK